MGGPLEDDEDGYCGFKRSNWVVGPCQLVCLLATVVWGTRQSVRALLEALQKTKAPRSS